MPVLMLGTEIDITTSFPYEMHSSMAYYFSLLLKIYIFCFAKLLQFCIYPTYTKSGEGYPCAGQSNANAFPSTVKNPWDNAIVENLGAVPPNGSKNDVFLSCHVNNV